MFVVPAQAGSSDVDAPEPRLGAVNDSAEWLNLAGIYLFNKDFRVFVAQRSMNSRLRGNDGNLMNYMKFVVPAQAGTQ
ncbi:hypothetical protein KDD30_18745 (plasmid) [Photobacterium sp. GJ3]|uniref:hypothetical protein n=1 Tax=Photobacterium sp. GJ3 TaxID=2829502 RepID=UPI001B8AD03E|nr:hypothetical protein [Photobacterium sp. GJ3]QUJ70171.1 hypothetical protein KDD30_18745 [Photobacterium sp. GJ3]